MAVQTKRNLEITKYQVRLNGTPSFYRKNRTRIVFRMPVLFDNPVVDGMVDDQIGLCCALLKAIWSKETEATMLREYPAFERWMIGAPLAYLITQPKAASIIHALEVVFESVKGTDVVIGIQKIGRQNAYKCWLKK